MNRLLNFLQPEEESALLASAPKRVFDVGDIVLEQNTTLQEIFVIDRGSVCVERDNGGQAIELAILALGEFFGEVSFVDGSPTSARVVAREPTEVRVLTPDLITKMDETDPTFGSRFYRSLAAILADRLRKTSLNVW
jgi:CRP/FNR family cyclic AMP-dependent transcriptional regulator